MSEATKTDCGLGADYTLILDDTHDPILYLGEAVPGSSISDPVWRIRKLDTTSGISTLWANGEASFVNQWDERLNLIYSS